MTTQWPCALLELYTTAPHTKWSGCLAGIYFNLLVSTASNTAQKSAEHAVAGRAQAYSHRPALASECTQPKMLHLTVLHFNIVIYILRGCKIIFYRWHRTTPCVAEHTSRCHVWCKEFTVEIIVCLSLKRVNSQGWPLCGSGALSALEPPTQ